MFPGLHGCQPYNTGNIWMQDNAFPELHDVFPELHGWRPCNSNFTWIQIICKSCFQDYMVACHVIPKIHLAHKCIVQITWCISGITWMVDKKHGYVIPELHVIFPELHEWTRPCNFGTTWLPNNVIQKMTKLVDAFFTCISKSTCHAVPESHI